MKLVGHILDHMLDHIIMDFVIMTLHILLKLRVYTIYIYTCYKKKQEIARLAYFINFAYKKQSTHIVIYYRKRLEK